MRNRSIKATFLVVTSAVLVACGGGGSSTTSTPTAPVMVNPITVVPAMGGFSAGANVSFIDPKGILIGTAQTNASGVAVVDLGKYSGPFISQVTGGPNVTVYNERTQGYEPFGAANSLLAVIPSVPTGANSRLGVTPLTNAAAAVLIPNPLSPVIPGSNASIQAAVAVANATVAVAAGLPAGVSLLSAPEPLTSPTSKITTTDPAAAAYGALLASMAINSTGSLVSSASALSKDAAANNGALPASASLLTNAASSLAAVVSANVAPASITSLGASLTNITKAVVPDPKLASAASQASITSQATASNGGVALPPTITIPVAPVAPPPVTTPAAPVAPPAPVQPPTPVVVAPTPACVTSIETLRAYNSQLTSVLTSPSVTTPTTGKNPPGGSWTLTAPVAGGVASTNIYQAIGTYDNCGNGGVGSTTWALDSTSGVPNLLLPACPTRASLDSSSGTVIVTTNGFQWGYTGDVINGVIYGFFPESGVSGSGLFTGTITGSTGGSAGLVLTTGTSSNLGFASGSGSAIINYPSTNILAGGLNYTVVKANTGGGITLVCR